MNDNVMNDNVIQLPTDATRACEAITEAFKDYSPQMVHAGMPRGRMGLVIGTNLLYACSKTGVLDDPEHIPELIGVANTILEFSNGVQGNDPITPLVRACMAYLTDVGLPFMSRSSDAG